jgi:hypothetical protein
MSARDGEIRTNKFVKMPRNGKAMFANNCPIKRPSTCSTKPMNAFFSVKKNARNKSCRNANIGMTYASPTKNKRSRAPSHGLGRKNKKHHNNYIHTPRRHKIQITHLIASIEIFINLHNSRRNFNYIQITGTNCTRQGTRYRETSTGFGKCPKFCKDLERRIRRSRSHQITIGRITPTYIVRHHRRVLGNV